MNNIPTGCKPFNYEEAIKDLSKIRVVNGYESSVAKLTLTYDKKHIIFEDTEGSLFIHNIDGTAVATGSDLFLKDETVVYVNVYRENVSIWHDSIEKAKDNALYTSISICALTITNGEVIKTETVHRY